MVAEDIACIFHVLRLSGRPTRCALQTPRIYKRGKSLFSPSLTPPSPCAVSPSSPSPRGRRPSAVGAVGTILPPLPRLPHRRLTCAQWERRGLFQQTRATLHAADPGVTTHPVDRVASRFAARPDPSPDLRRGSRRSRQDALGTDVSFHRVAVEEAHPAALHEVARAATGARAGRRVRIFGIRVEEDDADHSGSRTPRGTAIIPAASAASGSWPRSLRPGPSTGGAPPRPAR